MKIIPKYLTAWGKMPLILNDKGREDWVAEHATELPEVSVTAPRPLTETERRWKGDLTDDEYRAQRDALHASLLNAIKGSTIMGLTLMGGENSALPFGIGIMDIATGAGALDDMARSITRSAIPAARAARLLQRVVSPSITSKNSMTSNNVFTNGEHYIPSMDKGAPSLRDNYLKAKDWYEKDVIPRMKAMTTNTDDIEFLNTSNAVDPEGYIGVFPELKVDNLKGGEVSGQAVGGDNIYLDSKAPYRTLIHEMHHILRDKMPYFLHSRNGRYAFSKQMRYPERTVGYTEREANLLDDAYSFTSKFLKENNINPLYEKGASNTELRYNIAEKLGKNGEPLYGLELDDAIDNMSNIDLVYNLMFNNGYAEDFAKSLIYQNKSNLGMPLRSHIYSSANRDKLWENIDKIDTSKIREALKRVGIYTSIGSPSLLTKSNNVENTQ